MILSALYQIVVRRQDLCQYFKHSLRGSLSLALTWLEPDSVTRLLYQKDGRRKVEVGFQERRFEAVKS